MRSLALAVAATIVLMGCQEKGRARSAACDAPVQPSVTLIPSDKCLLDLVRQRCEGLDVCFVECLTTGQHMSVGKNGEPRRVGGGCWHLCDYGGRKGWEPPEGMAACPVY
jgi:hypothetical protein